MIQLTSNSGSNVYLTISERTANTNNIRLVLTGLDNNDTVEYLLTTDISVNPVRWNQYLLNDSGSLTQRHYEYAAYTSSILLEKGQLQVNGLPTTATYTYTGSNQSITFI